MFVRFVCSQAVQYDWLKTDYPNLYARVRDRIAVCLFHALSVVRHLHEGKSIRSDWRHMGRDGYEPSFWRKYSLQKTMI